MLKLWVVKPGGAVWQRSDVFLLFYLVIYARVLVYMGGGWTAHKIDG